MPNKPEVRYVGPQAGFQTEFCASPADVTISGGIAGCGKTYGVVLDAMKYCIPREGVNIKYNQYSSVVFRRISKEITNAGGLWDEAGLLYPLFGAEEKLSMKTYKFPSGAKVVFTHLQYDKTAISHHGGQYPAIYFDELTTFTAYQFWYLFSRNRTTCGVRAFIKATCNPQTQGWVKNLIEWFLYPDDYHIEELQGYPIEERCGKLRYFTRYKNVMFWGNSRDELVENLPPEVYNYVAAKPMERIRSMTFIQGRMEDNKLGDPNYEGNILAMSHEDQLRLGKGCWKYHDGEDVLYTYIMMKNLFTNKFLEDVYRRSPKYLTADIALEGSDKFVICCWRGWHMYKSYVVPKCNGKEVEKILKDILRKERIPVSNMAYDADGVGGFLGGYFKPAIAINGSGGPRPKKGEKIKDNYTNLRAQLYRETAKRMEANEVLVTLAAGQEDTQDSIEKQFMAHTKITVGGKLGVISKDLVKAKLPKGISPDDSDAIAMRSIFDLERVEKHQDLGTTIIVR